MDDLRSSLIEPATQPTATATAAEVVSSATTATLTDAAYVFGLVVGSERPLEDLVTVLRGRVEALRDPLSPEATAELQRQLVVLDSLYLRFAAEATRTRKGSVHQTMLLRAALQAQQAYARTFALLHALAVSAKTATICQSQIELHDDDSSDY